jgi:hypothetical protein
MFMPAPSGSVVEGASHARPDSLGLEVVRHCAPCVLVHTAATAPLVVPPQWRGVFAWHAH